jgi:hypothetical protein
MGDDRLRLATERSTVSDPSAAMLPIRRIAKHQVVKLGSLVEYGFLGVPAEIQERDMNPLRLLGF